MKTEAEAQACWCPFVRLLMADPMREDYRLKDTAAFNAVSLEGKRGNVPAAHCIASACMMWVWLSAEDDPAGQPPHTWPDLRPFHPADSPRRLIRRGLCGLVACGGMGNLA